LQRLDISKNRLSSLDGVSMNTRLRWLSAAGNELTSLGSSLKELVNLEVSSSVLNDLYASAIKHSAAAVCVM
jgi:Leucine-rich repeat (LRR) protein